MDAHLLAAVETLVATETGQRSSIVSSRPVSGGCISQGTVATLADGRRYFVKSNDAVPDDFFRREIEGLQALAAVGAVRVPTPVGAGTVDGLSFVVMEAIDVGRQRPGTQEELGRSLASLHRASRGTRFGLAHDNYLGATPQPNGQLDDGCAFWRERRLGHQLTLARANGVASSELLRRGERLLDRLDRFLDLPEEPSCLVHGDLWGGNVLADAAGTPVLVDPAVYHGHREAELAMTRLFGGFDGAFYGAYEEAWPLADGAARRGPLYELYHQLNHLNLFGTGYLDACLRIVRRYT